MFGCRVAVFDPSTTAALAPVISNALSGSGSRWPRVFLFFGLRHAVKKTSKGAYKRNAFIHSKDQVVLACKTINPVLGLVASEWLQHESTHAIRAAGEGDSNSWLASRVHHERIAVFGRNRASPPASSIRDKKWTPKRSGAGTSE